MFNLPNMYVCKCNTKKNPKCRLMDCRRLYYPYYRDYRENFYLDKLKEGRENFYLDKLKEEVSKKHEKI